MGLMGDRCYFCLSGKAVEAVDVAPGNRAHLCESCLEQYRESVSNAERSPLELPRQDPSVLCIQCGLCCVMLSARVEEEEVGILLEEAREHNIPPKDLTFDQFCSRGRYGAKEEYLINMPCRFLIGRILSYVNCAAYSITRPKVCGKYLCKIAVQYSLGLISLPEAIFLLRSSFLKGDVTVFNWNQITAEEDEERISVLRELSDYSKRLREDGLPDDQIEFLMCARLTPRYIPSSLVGHTKFNMFMSAVDRRDFSIEAFFDPAELEGWSEAQKEAAGEAVRRVLSDIRELFKRADDDPPRGDGDGQGEDEGADRPGAGGEGAGGGALDGEPEEGEDEGGITRRRDDDEHLGGRRGVSDGGPDPRGSRGTEGEGLAEDAEDRADRDPAPGPRPRADGPDEEGEGRRVDPVKEGR